METARQLSDRFKEVFLDGTWIANTNYKNELEHVNWEMATKKIETLNTIVALTYHVNYYVQGVLEVLEGGPLRIRDAYSFDFDHINSQEDWEALKISLLDNALKFANNVASISNARLDNAFADPKYGNYRRNIEGLIEHSYYHLGQITLIKKQVLSSLT